MSRTKRYTLTFDEVELTHILTSICDDRDEGHYWGRKDQYIKRVDRIIGKLEAALSGEDAK